VEETTFVDLEEVHADLDVNPRSVGSYSMTAEFGALITSIQADGVKEPLVVIYEWDEELKDQGILYRVLAGHRRFKAGQVVQDIKRKKDEDFRLKVPVHLRTDVTPEQYEIELISHQVLNQPFKPTELATAIQILKEKKISDKKVQKLLGFSAKKIRDTLRLLLLSDEAKEIVDSGNVLITNAYLVTEYIERFGKPTEEELRKNLTAFFIKQGSLSNNEFQKNIQKVIKDFVGDKKDLGKSSKTERKPQEHTTEERQKVLQQLSNRAQANASAGKGTKTTAKALAGKKAKLEKYIKGDWKFKSVKEAKKILLELTTANTGLTQIEFLIKNLTVSSDAETNNKASKDLDDLLDTDEETDDIEEEEIDSEELEFEEEDDDDSETFEFDDD